MRHIYKGNIESLSVIVDEINNNRKTYFLPTNNIIDVKLNDKSY